MRISINKIKLKALRSASGLSIVNASYDADLSLGHISRIENGNIKAPRIDVLYKIAKLYNVKIEELLIIEL